MPTPRSLRRPALAALVTLVALATGSAGAATLEKTLEKTYPLAAGGEVFVENVNGAVVVDTWDRPEVRVRATKNVRAGSDEAAAEAMARLQVDVVESAGRLHVQTRRAGTEDGFFSWLRGQGANTSISYRLTVPRGIRLDAETVNGAITLNGVDGDVEASTTNGSIKVTMLEVPPDAELAFSTTNGSVTIALPADVRTDLRLRTTNGGISVDLPLDEVASRSRTRLDATVNGGGGSLRVVTTNGGIRIVES
jgi:hypothetical protein